jgi:aminoglycoside phosphotransferase (APT) family kinase protein
MTVATELSADIASWIEQATGATLLKADRIPGGGTREGWFIDVGDASGSRELFLRYSPNPLPASTAFHSLAGEAEVIAALHRAGLPVAGVHAVHPDREAVLFDRIGGDTWFSLIKDPDEQVRVAQDFIRSLARIHALDPAELGIDRLGPVQTAREHALDRIADIRRRAMQPDGSIDPLIRLSADWLEANVPDYDGPVVLVQGDTGPGNFLYRDGKVTAVVDWELCHWGDPMDDIAWLSLRTVQDTFTYLPDRLAEYAALSGHAIDVERIWYYRVFAETTMVTLNSREDVAAGTRDVGNGMIYEQLHRRLWLEALDHVLRLHLPGFDEPAATEEPVWHGLYADVLGMLKTASTKVSDPFALRWTKGSARVIQYLQQADLHGWQFQADEQRDIESLLGHPVPSLAEGRRELARAQAAGAVSDSEYTTYAWRRVQREDYLMRGASGALRRRTWPPLTAASA